MARIQEIINQHMMTSTSKHSKSLAEMAVESYNNEAGDMTGYDCPICKNKGMVAFLKDGQDLYKQCDCIEIRRAAKLQSASGLEMLLEKYTFENYKITEPWQQYIFNKAKGFVEKKAGWFYIGGRAGTGKTHICTALVGQLLKEAVPCKYMLWRDEASRLKAKVNDEEYTAMIRPLKETRCLYIDDFFKGGVTQGDINLAFEILNSRYNNGLMTVISSEKTIKEVLEIDEAIGSRIYEKAKEHAVQIKNGNNYRLKKGD